MSRFFVIDAAGSFYRHLPGYFVSWGPIGQANEFQTAMSARYIADQYKGARVVELRGKNVCEVE